MSSRRSGHGEPARAPSMAATEGSATPQSKGADHLRRARLHGRVNPRLEKRKAPTRAAGASRSGLHLHARRNCSKRDRILPSPACGRGAGGEGSRGLRRIGRSASEPRPAFPTPQPRPTPSSPLPRPGLYVDAGQILRPARVVLRAGPARLGLWMTDDRREEGPAIRRAFFALSQSPPTGRCGSPGSPRRAPPTPRCTRARASPRRGSTPPA